jgi:predicted ribosomally synthesized peptide with nif11-like leader
VALSEKSLNQNKRRKIMSIESAKAFYERMVADEAFRTQYQNANNGDDRRNILLAEGYVFTPEEWETVSTELSKSSQEEISDAELEAVSGGVNSSFLDCFNEHKPFPIRPLYGAPIE